MNINAFTAFFIMNTHLTILFTLQRTAHHFKHRILRPLARWISDALTRFNLTTPYWIIELMSTTLEQSNGEPLEIDDIENVCFGITAINKDPGYLINCFYNGVPYWLSMKMINYLPNELKTQAESFAERYISGILLADKIKTQEEKNNSKNIDDDSKNDSSSTPPV